MRRDESTTHNLELIKLVRAYSREVGRSIYRDFVLQSFTPPPRQHLRLDGVSPTDFPPPGCLPTPTEPAYVKKGGLAPLLIPATPTRFVDVAAPSLVVRFALSDKE